MQPEKYTVVLKMQRNIPVIRMFALFLLFEIFLNWIKFQRPVPVTWCAQGPWCMWVQIKITCYIEHLVNRIKKKVTRSFRIFRSSWLRSLHLAGHQWLVYIMVLNYVLGDCNGDHGQQQININVNFKSAGKWEKYWFVWNLI